MFFEKFILTGQPAFFADRGFTSHENLSWYKLYNMNGRMYAPVVGWFLSADPYIQNPGSTQNYNRYSYCLNNPLKYTDLSGNQMTAYKYFMQNVLGESGGRGFDSLTADLGSLVFRRWENGMVIDY